MTPEQVQLVRPSFTKVMAVKMNAARGFYERLFAVAPEVRPMFSNDIEAQARKLMDTADFTPQVKSAWISLYAAIAAQMRSAARPKAVSA